MVVILTLVDHVDLTLIMLYEEIDETCNVLSGVAICENILMREPTIIS